MIYDHNHDFHFSAVKTLRSLRPMLFWRKYERDRKQAAVQCSKMFPPPRPALFLTNVTNEAPLSWNSPPSVLVHRWGLFHPVYYKTWISNIKWSWSYRSIIWCNNVRLWKISDLFSKITFWKTWECDGWMKKKTDRILRIPQLQELHFTSDNKKVAMQVATCQGRYTVFLVL